MTLFDIEEERKARNRKYNRDYLDRLGKEAEKEYYRKRYVKHKDSYNAQSRKWAKQNPHKMQASVHQTTVRKKYPEAFAESDINTKDLAEFLKERRGCACVYCGEPAFHIDHKLPLSRKGSHTWANIVMACEFCNLAKRDNTPEEFLIRVRKILDYN